MPRVTADRPVDDVDHRDLVDALDAVEDAGQALDVRLRSALGINAVDWAVLRWVDRVHRRGGAVRVGDLADHFGVSSGSATEIVHRLTRAGLLVRVPHAEDGRVRRLVPTDDAHARMTALLGGTRGQLEALAARIPTGERRRLVQLLCEVAGILAADADAAD